MQKNNKKTQSIVFLDVDGVLTSLRCNGYYDFDLWAVNYLRWACEKSGAKIVMSSAWRTLPDAQNTFTKTFGKYLHSDWKTGIADTRGDEIDEWLKEHPQVKNFVIIDDTLNGLENHKEWLVFTSLEDGLLLRHMMEISKKLGIKEGVPRLEKVFNNPICFYTTREKRQIGYTQWVSELQERNARKLVQEAADEVN